MHFQKASHYHSMKIHAPLMALENEAKAMEVAIIFAHDTGQQYVIF